MLDKNPEIATVLSQFVGEKMLILSKEMNRQARKGIDLRIYNHNVRMAELFAAESFQSPRPTHDLKTTEGREQFLANRRNRI